ncbi:MAG: hypothetical protein CO031_00870 [Candidatus Nealsonbacteria bacterium CG_4_9_14_0_2_um_filter_37_38]|nr:MAG: hypothetical protein COZ89_01815 [Candidatus Nealsonbacteria bacterium CG_4_8_14_3_um_filter_37_23]PJC51743.1 MAG: hypothetical protein CO031_00870 [Candidatus Nealsonbacteria bacterium CG_4_9_14_0_2_um_filter_37_38]
MGISNGVKEIIKKFIPAFLLSWYHFGLVFLGAVLYQFPSKKIKVIGVTGTNGKSTVVELTTKILEEAGYKVASLSSIKFKIRNKEWPNTLKMTMPGRLKLQKFLREAVNAGCQYAVIEVTSEGIKQHRHQFIDFDVAVFTNLTPEHIEAHGGFEKYRQEKGKLFRTTKKIHIVNSDDKNAQYFLNFPADKKYLYKIKNQKSKANYRERFSVIEAEDVQVLPSGLKFSLNNTKFNLKLLGEFNVYNALAAVCIGVSQEINLETCKKALEKVEGIPGRMEEVISHPFKVFVDYAFTPNALEKVYQTLTHQPINLSTNKLICVLGACGGGRDKWKRPVLGEIAAKYCDEVIITNEDPYNEDPIDIIDQVAQGAEKISIDQFTPTPNFGVGASQHKSAVHKILDRRKAIRKSLELANSNDVVVITGKGSEPWVCVAKGKKIPWDDRKIVREEFHELKTKS